MDAAPHMDHLMQGFPLIDRAEEENRRKVSALNSNSTDTTFP